jgi:hypothetical protein
MQNDILFKSIIDIVSIARLAPSVHNGQPWRVKYKDNRLIILRDEKIKLQYSDPTGRQAAISLGIFAESCVIAMESLGIKHEEPVVDKNGDINVKLIGSSGKKTGKKQFEDIEALKNRFTDRSIYKQITLSKNMIKEIQSSWHAKSVEVLAAKDKDIINECAYLTKKGLSLALSSPDFRNELSDYMVPSAKTPYGIPLPGLESNRLKSLPIKMLLKSNLGQRRQAVLEYKRWRSASLIIFILSTGDSYKYWVESGRAYLRASLAIEKLGLQQATSAAIVEASDFHEDIERRLSTNKRIQCILRAGSGSQQYKKSGRYKPEDLIIT